MPLMKAIFVYNEKFGKTLIIKLRLIILMMKTLFVLFLLATILILPLVIKNEPKFLAYGYGTANPQIVVAPYSGSVGDHIAVIGGYFIRAAGHSITISINSIGDPKSLAVVGTAATDSSGSFTKIFVVPALASGDYDVVAEDLVNGTIAHHSFTIIGSAPPQATGTTTNSINLTKPTSSVTEATPSLKQIPNWVKNTAKWWSEGSVGDNDFVKGIQYMIEQGIMKIPPLSSGYLQSSTHIPQWIKTNANWWANGQIDDSEFVKGMQYLVQVGIIQVSIVQPRTP